MKGVWIYLFRAADQYGKTLESLLSQH
ncbi:hypothetical protein [uncultured Ruegeria sp.]